MFYVLSEDLLQRYPFVSPSGGIVDVVNQLQREGKIFDVEIKLAIGNFLQFKISPEMVNFVGSYQYEKNLSAEISFFDYLKHIHQLTTNDQVITAVVENLKRWVKDPENIKKAALPEIFNLDKGTRASIPLVDYFRRIEKYTALEDSSLIWLAMLAYIKLGDIKVTARNIHKLSMTAFLAAMKFFYDKGQLNSTMAQIAGLEKKDVNLLEHEWLELIWDGRIKLHLKSLYFMLHIASLNLPQALLSSIGLEFGCLIAVDKASILLSDKCQKLMKQGSIMISNEVTELTQSPAWFISIPISNIHLFTREELEELTLLHEMTKNDEEEKAFLYDAFIIAEENFTDQDKDLLEKLKEKASVIKLKYSEEKIGRPAWFFFISKSQSHFTSDELQTLMVLHDKTADEEEERLHELERASSADDLSSSVESLSTSNNTVATVPVGANPSSLFNSTVAEIASTSKENQPVNQESGASICL